MLSFNEDDEEVDQSFAATGIKFRSVKKKKRKALKNKKKKKKYERQESESNNDSRRKKRKEETRREIRGGKGVKAERVKDEEEKEEEYEKVVVYHDGEQDEFDTAFYDEDFDEGFMGDGSKVMQEREVGKQLLFLCLSL